MRELFLLPKQFVYEIIALLHLGISFYDGIHVYLKHRGYCLAVGGWPLRQTQTIRIAGCQLNTRLVGNVPIAYSMSAE